MLSIAVEIVEPLRSEGAECAGLEEKYRQLLRSRDEALQKLKTFTEG